MTPLRSLAPLLAALLLATPSGAAQGPAAVPAAPAAGAHPDSLAARVDAVFAPWAVPGSPGAAVAVVRDGEVVLARGYGLANLEYDVPITPRSVFHVASVSKHFTTFAVGLLAREGKLSLDDDIRTHLPEIHDFGHRITLRHLIHHTSGIRDQWELLAMAGWRLDDVITRDQIVRMMRHQRELNFAPGTEHLYSNMGYTLLAEIVERVSGMPFARFTEERIFRPLGMADTHFHDDHRRVVPRRAYSYAPHPDGGFQASPLNYATVGATSLFTTVEDLAKWDRNFRTGEVGGAALLEEMLTRGELADGARIPYAHALVHGEFRGLRTIGHGGADAGYRANFLRFPDQGVSVIVLGNLGTLNATRLAQQVAEVYLADWMAPLPAAAPRPAAAAGRGPRLSPAELSEWVGLYASPRDDQTRRIELRDGTLYIASGAAYPLRPLSRSRFAVDDIPVAVEIRFDAGDAGTRMSEVVDGGAPIVYEAVVPVPAARLEEFAGAYHSEELGTTYRLVVRDGRLVAEHRRHDDTPLTPTFPDRFLGETWWFRRLHFTRDAAGRVDGFHLTGSRVRNLRFVRQDP